MMMLDSLHEFFSRFVLSPYWAAHFLLLLSYVPLRMYVFTQPKALMVRDQWLGITREATILVTLALFTYRKYGKSPTMDTFISHSILYAKTTMGVLAFLISYKFAAWYLIVAFVMFLGLRRPAYARAHNVKAMSPADFEFNVLSAAGKKRTWVIFFHASWSSACDDMFPMFAKLSVRYGGDKHLKFGSFDVGRWAEFARKHKLNIDSGATSGALPTFALYEKSQETRRLPPVDEKTGQVQPTFIDAEGAIAYFDLDRRLTMEKEYAPRQ